MIDFLDNSQHKSNERLNEKESKNNKEDLFAPLLREIKAGDGYKFIHLGKPESKKSRWEKASKVKTGLGIIGGGMGLASVLGYGYKLQALHIRQR